MAVISLRIVLTEAKSGRCVAILLHEQTIKILATIKRREDNRAASFWFEGYDVISLISLAYLNSYFTRRRQKIVGKSMIYHL